MSYRKIRKPRSLGGVIEPRKTYRMETQVPAKQDILARIRRRLKRAERWKASARSSEKPPAHIAADLQVYRGLTISA